MFRLLYICKVNVIPCHGIVLVHEVVHKKAKE